MLSKFKIEFGWLHYLFIPCTDIYEYPAVCTMQPGTSNKNEDLFPNLLNLQAETWLL